MLMNQIHRLTLACSIRLQGLRQNLLVLHVKDELSGWSKSMALSTPHPAIDKLNPFDTTLRGEQEARHTRDLLILSYIGPEFYIFGVWAVREAPSTNGQPTAVYGMGFRMTCILPCALVL